MIFSPRSGTDLAPPKLAADNSADLPDEAGQELVGIFAI
jgi:hypothetical protein